MPDITFNEYKGFSKQELGRVVRDEAEKMFQLGHIKEDFENEYRHGEKRTGSIFGYFTKIPELGFFKK